MDQAKTMIVENPVLEPELKENMLRLINFIERNPSIKYFPLTKIKNITQTEKYEVCLQIAAYFCGERMKIFEPRYSYTLENNCDIELTRNEFKFYYVNRDEALEKNGHYICPVLKERLAMYFTTTITKNILSIYDEWDID